MQRLARLTSALLLLSKAAPCEPSPGAAPSVSLLEPRPSDRAVSERLMSELSSEGYSVERSGSTSTPCDSPRSRETEPPVESVWIRIEWETFDGPADRTFVCYRSPAGRLFDASARASNSDPATLAISTVETLNGLRSSATVPSPAPSGARAPVVREAPPPSHFVASSVFAGGTFAFSPLGLPPLLGSSATLGSGISDHVSIAYDGFVTWRPAEIERPDRRIEARAAWIRIGPRLSWSASLFDVDGSLLAGPAFFWTEADAEPPRVGSADSTAACLVSLGLGVEVPRRSRFFLRVAALGSVLLPRVAIEAGDEDVPAWLFVETSLGLGFRWFGAGAL
jgi:hypothetical protein